MKIDEQAWLRPLRFVARSIKYAWLFWLWWIGVGSFKPDGEDVRNEWNQRDLWFYLVLTIYLYHSAWRCMQSRGYSLQRWGVVPSQPQ